MKKELSIDPVAAKTQQDPQFLWFDSGYGSFGSPINVIFLYFNGFLILIDNLLFGFITLIQGLEFFLAQVHKFVGT